MACPSVTYINGLSLCCQSLFLPFLPCVEGFAELVELAGAGGGFAHLAEDGLHESADLFLDARAFGSFAFVFGGFRSADDVAENVAEFPRGSEQCLGQDVGEFFDRIRLVTVCDEEGIAGLDDDEILHAEQGDVGAGGGIENDVVARIDLRDHAIDPVFRAFLIKVFCDGDP